MLQVAGCTFFMLMLRTFVVLKFLTLLSIFFRSTVYDMYNLIDFIAEGGTKCPQMPFWYTSSKINKTPKFISDRNNNLHFNWYLLISICRDKWIINS